MNNHWVLPPAEWDNEQALTDAVLASHEEIHRRHFANSPGVNQALGLQVRACRRIEQWRALLMLTPWMLSRLWFPDQPPNIEIPREWLPDQCANGNYRLLGPCCSFDILGQTQSAHLNYHAELGHYLLQPLVLNMQPYTTAEAVFEAWNEVIRIRDENLRKMARDCPLQKEISRRELFRRMTGSDQG
ncbi:[NiFe]-hydrogenase assembly chaperone HybE [Thiolapillus sp.]